jgi:hypothetical protein
MDIWRRAAKLNRAGASGLDLAGVSIESGRADHLPPPRMGLNRMVHSVLARLRPEHIRRNGAAVAVVEDALPSDYYEALATSFPSVEFIAGPGPLDNNRAYRKAAPEMIGRSETPPIWAEFLAYHSSRAFFDEFCDLWGEDIAGLHPALEENFGKPLRQFSVGVRGAGKRTDPTNQDHDLVLDCQVSINSPVTEGSSVRGPHLDSPRKLFNALLYFRHPDDRSTGGDLEFYRLKGGRAPDKWSAIDPDLVERTHVVPYRANTLVMFINSPGALHGVSRRSVTPLPRRYVDFLGECHGGRSAAFFAPPDRRNPGFWRGLLQRWR